MESTPNHRAHICATALAELVIALSRPHMPGYPGAEIRAAEGVLERLMREQASQFELRTIESQNGRERFRILRVDGRIGVEGSTPSALLFGVNGYFREPLHRR
jgi:alpha-N-acetylglucosaminidase